jgi:hypothetical protein
MRRKVFDFAQLKGQNKLERLGADPSDDFFDGVLVIFTAKRKRWRNPVSHRLY